MLKREDIRQGVDVASVEIQSAEDHIDRGRREVSLSADSVMVQFNDRVKRNKGLCPF